MSFSIPSLMNWAGCSFEFYCLPLDVIQSATEQQQSDNSSLTPILAETETYTEIRTRAVVRIHTHFHLAANFAAKLDKIPRVGLRNPLLSKRRRILVVLSYENIKGISR